MNLRQLKYFVRVVEAGNMTRAAEELHVAQPALGMQIRQLEEDLGVALLVRHSRGVEPTDAGALLHTKALAILELVDETRKAVSARDGAQSESIRLGLTPSLMQLVAPEIAVNVREQIPHVFLSLAEEMSHRLVEALSREEIDAALAYEIPESHQLSRIALYQEDLVLVTQPGPKKGEPITLTDALEESLALPEPGDSVRNLVARTARELGLDLKVAYEIRSIPAIRNLILRGAASGILPLGTVIDEVRSGKLDARPIMAPTLRRTLFLAYSRKRGPLRNELALTGVIRGALTTLTKAVGPLGHPLPPRA